jgi:hypothetical protein
MPIGPDSYFHDGYVVKDLTAAIDQIAAAVGVRFQTPASVTMSVANASGPFSLDIQFTYSVEGPHHYELIVPERPGSVYESDAWFSHHHHGYWCDDLAGDIERLRKTGFECELWGVGEDGEPARMVYMNNGRGMRVELVDAGFRQRMEAFWEGAGW